MADNPSDVAKKVLVGFEEDSQQHDPFVEKVNRWYRAYRGVIETRSKANDWTNKHHPAYAAQILETMVAALTDPKPRWPLRAKARFDAPPVLADLRLGARQLGLLLNDQRVRPGYLRDQRIHRLQALVASVTAEKISWGYELADKPRHVSKSDPVYNDYGDHIGNMDYSDIEVNKEIVLDDPVSEVCDIRHVIWPWNAPTAERMQRVTHRLFYTFDELKRQECKANKGRKHEGPCQGGIYHDVDKLKESKGQTSERASDETDLFRSRPGKDDIEVLECWYRDADGIRLCALGNKKVVLREGPSPYWHNKLPFVFCSGMPQPFQIPGMSDIELIEELQEMMWTLANQRLDNLQLINNAIILLRDDVDDPDAFEFYPGAVNLVAAPEQVQMWSPNPMVAEISLTAEAQIKSDLQSISGGGMWAGGDASGSRSDTATEASILTNLAQRRVAAKKQFFLAADAEAGNLYIDLNDQFLTEERWIERVGQDAQQGWELIDPAVFRDHKFKIELDASDESLMRTERRAEAQAKLQVALSAVPVFAALSSAGQTPGLNIKAFMDDFLDAFDAGADKERYYSAHQQPQEQLGAPQPQAPPGQEPGATAPQAVDPNSPSNAFSQSPVAAQQRMGAASGGPVNIG